jgi:hypothetical protein
VTDPNPLMTPEEAGRMGQVSATLFASTVVVAGLFVASVRSFLPAGHVTFLGLALVIVAQVCIVASLIGGWECITDPPGRAKYRWLLLQSTALLIAVVVLLAGAVTLAVTL